MIDVLLGLQWGDEGKGKVVDYLASKYDIVARFQGGPNAGHTLYVNGHKIVLRTIPSGIFHTEKQNLIGNGVVIDPVTLKEEIENLQQNGIPVTPNLNISYKAHLILPTHRALDAASEHAKGEAKIGSTLKGIGPAYMDKTGRNGLRVGDILSQDWKSRYEKLREKHLELLRLYDDFQIDWQAWEAPFFEAIEYLKSLNIVNGEYWINDQLAKGKTILAEGAQGSMLDVDYGTYPFVTSSNTISAGVCTGLGVAPSQIGEVYGITKAYCTRVGSGPFPTELFDEAGEQLREAGGEFGAVTKRPRRCGWIDLVALKYTVMLSGVTQLIMTKADILDGFESVEACIAYNVNGTATEQIPYDICTDKIEPLMKTFSGWRHTPISKVDNAENLPVEFKEFCKFVSEYLGVPVRFVSNGTGRDQLLVIDQL